jgi:hypothetical protein
MGEDRSAWACADPERLEHLVNEFRRREANGSSEEELAAWLKDQTVSFGDSGNVLSAARGITTVEAYGALHATDVWRSATTRFHVTLPTGSISEFRNPNGRTFSVGDTLNMPNVLESPHRSEPGRGTVWRVIAVEPDDDPAFTARLVVEPLGRLEPPR